MISVPDELLVHGLGGVWRDGECTVTGERLVRLRHWQHDVLFDHTDARALLGAWCYLKQGPQ